MNTKLILDFLSKLSQNNNSAWMTEHKNEYDIARKEFYSIVENLIHRLNLMDSTLRNIEPKSCIFRLNRDIRFSANKTPYKEFMGAYVANGGRKGDNAGYYIHFQPDGQSFLAAGFYMPSAEKLNFIRQEISESGDELLKIINAPKFKSIFGEFQGEKLKKAPRNFSPDNKFIEFIKFKSFEVLHFYKDKFVIDSAKFFDDVLQKFEIAMPLNHYLNNAAQP